jgi:hypothetical protein
MSAVPDQGAMHHRRCTHVETGLIPHNVHYVVADQPEAVDDLIQRYASLPSK